MIAEKRIRSDCNSPVFLYSVKWRLKIPNFRHIALKKVLKVLSIVGEVTSDSCTYLRIPTNKE